MFCLFLFFYVCEWPYFCFVFSVYTFEINSIKTNQILIIEVLLCFTSSRRVAVFQRERLLGFLRQQNLARGSRGLSTEGCRPADHQHQGGTGPCVCVWTRGERSWTVWRWWPGGCLCVVETRPSQTGSRSTCGSAWLTRGEKEHGDGWMGLRSTKGFYISYQ